MVPKNNPESGVKVQNLRNFLALRLCQQQRQLDFTAQFTCGYHHLYTLRIYHEEHHSHLPVSHNSQNHGTGLSGEKSCSEKPLSIIGNKQLDAFLI